MIMLVRFFFCFWQINLLERGTFRIQNLQKMHSSFRQILGEYLNSFAVELTIIQGTLTASL